MVNKSELELAVKSSNSIRQTLVKLGMSLGGGNSSLLRKQIDELNIDTSHFTFLNTRKIGEKLPDVKYFAKNTSRSGVHTKKRLMEDHNFEEKCDECGLGPEWNNKPINLQVDHIDGDHHNNEIDNLRFLCPNCHSQCETFGSKRLKGTKKIHKCKCGKEITKKSTRCNNCENSNRIYKSKCPSEQELERLIWEYPTTKIASKFGVSDKAVEKWCKKLGIKKPGPGYWMKKK